MNGTVLSVRTLTRREVTNVQSATLQKEPLPDNSSKLYLTSAPEATFCRQDRVRVKQWNLLTYYMYSMMCGRTVGWDTSCNEKFL